MQADYPGAVNFARGYPQAAPPSEMSDLSAEEEIASYLTQRLDGEETLRVLRGLPERLQELSAKHRAFTEVRFHAHYKPNILMYLKTQRWDEIADLQSENSSLVESG